MSVTDPRLAGMLAWEEETHQEYQAALDKAQSLREQLAAAERELPVLRVMASGATRTRVEYVEQLADADWEAGNRRR